ncbi:MAG: hypothetical protein HY360_01555 [Verrucomicrobia bacterium]|nr:hypothetical protein [Verrucomicrobiota bacterium]
MNIKVSIQRKASGKRADGIVRQMLLVDLIQWMEWPYTEKDEDRLWDWLEIFSETNRLGGKYECYSLLVHDELHGLMALDLSNAEAQVSQALLLDYLATNPVDRSLADGFKYVGLSLVAAAVLRSKASGFAGRLYLESLPGAVRFYERLGFERQERKSSAEYPIYLLSSTRAEKLLGSLKEEGILS